MLLMAAKRWQVTTLSVLCVRDQRGKLDTARSLCLSVVLPSIPSGDSHDNSTCVRLLFPQVTVTALHCMP